MAQDVADHQFLAVGLGRRDDAFGVGHRRCQRLFDEDMAAGLERLHRIVGMAVGIGGDAGDIGLFVAQRLVEGAPDAIAGQSVRQRHVGAVDQCRDLEARIGVIGQRMAAAHIAEAGDDDAKGFLRTHLTAPEVMPRISCREKMT